MVGVGLNLDGSQLIMVIYANGALDVSCPKAWPPVAALTRPETERHYEPSLETYSPKYQQHPDDPTDQAKYQASELSQ